MLKQFCVAAAIVLAIAGSAGASTVNVVDAGSNLPDTYFLPVGMKTAGTVYRRTGSQDWGWAHSGIATAFTTAQLLISGFDVDDALGERDVIQVMRKGEWVSLGYLRGQNARWTYTAFDLTPDFFDDIVAGLQIRIDIDSTNKKWLVTLAKSVISLDGATPPDPQPTAALPPVSAVPVPAALPLALGGLFALGGLGLRRRKRG